MTFKSTLYRYSMLVMYLIGRLLGAFLYGAKKFNQSVTNRTALNQDVSTATEQKTPAPFNTPSRYPIPHEEVEPIRYVTVIQERRQQTTVMKTPRLQTTQGVPDYDVDKPFRNTFKNFDDDSKFNMGWL